MRLLLIILFLGILNPLICQNEFKEYNNGLIYSPFAMSKLSQIVGDENENFRNCDLTKTFKSIPQSSGYYFEIDIKYKKELNKDFQNNISIDTFLDKYEKEKKEKVLVVKLEYENYSNEEMVNFKMFPEKNSMSFKKKNLHKYFKGKWIASFSKNNIIKVIYLENNIWARNIPYKFSRMIQYSECLIDTTATIHPKEAKNSNGWYSEKNMPLAQNTFFKYIEKSFGEVPPKFNNDGEWDGEKYLEYSEKLNKYEIKKHQFVKNTLSKEKQFNVLLNNALKETLEEKKSSEEFENYVQKYLSKKKALELKRNRIVIGSCSQDNSPRTHALNIAKLSAESYSWDIFLRAHLNIMNDRFQRVSDGSYALSARKTYVKELEELNINVKELVLGIILRTSNPSNNHYYGSIRRMGRAVSESEDVEGFRKIIIDGVSNNMLDDYNRLLLFYLYANLQYNYDTNNDKKFNKKHVEKIRKELPIYLQTIDY